MIHVYLGQSGDPLCAALPFFIIDVDEYSGKRRLWQFNDGKVESHEVAEGVYNPKPTFVLLDGVANEFLKGMAEAAARRGIKTQDDHVREGKLEATERHLADMRRLAFGKDIL